MTQPLWHLLQVSDVLDLEFASALAESVPVLAWEPLRSFHPASLPVGLEPERPYADGSTLRVRKLPLLRGFARPPMSWFARTGVQVTERLLRQTSDPEHSPLVCTTPYFASVAERWPGPVVYWLTDLIAEYSSADRAMVHRLDRRMCHAATLVCPNSQRLADYLTLTAQCDPVKIEITPNATRQINIYPQRPAGPGPRPDALQIAGLRDSIGRDRPIAGVIGNLAGNMDWLLLERTIELTPWLHWVFVGPTSMDMANTDERRARKAVMEHKRAHFVGRKPYGELAAYARCFDVAVLPYKRREPTFSGSSTRFYEHLAACRPMVSTAGLEELIHKTPLLTLVHSAEEASLALEALQRQAFDDGLTDLRWRASQRGTWQTRAATVRAALEQRLIPGVAAEPPARMEIGAPR